MKLFAVVLALVVTAAICADLITDIRAGRIERWPTRLRQSVRLGRLNGVDLAAQLGESVCVS